MESRAGANVQQNGDRNMEKLMDEYLKAHGLQRKKIAKDGSCLFRAVAEQVLQCQGLHARVRAECVKYLRQNRDQYESFIEGDFEEYLHVLQDPQSWVGQVEISALAVLYKHDFIIYRQPGEPPVNITEHGYPKKVLLCFLNGNHYDSVYPISFIQNAAMCQSILYELLYERVCGVDRGALTPSLRASKAKNESVETEERESSGDSDLDDGGDFWSSEATGRTAGVNNRTAYKGRGRGQARGGGRGCLLPKVQECLNPTVFRNMEYKMWLRLNRVQQRRDFCIAAGMHYKAGDKCQVRLNNTDRFYSAYIQDVSPGDGPVTVFIDELRETYSVPLWNLRTFSEDSWSTVTEKSKRQTASSTNGPTERGGKSLTTPMRSVSHASTVPPGSAPSNHTQQQQNSAGAEPHSLGKNDSSGRSGQGAGRLCSSAEEVDDNALLEILNKDEENFPTLEASAQAASVEGSRRAERKGSRKKAVADTKEPPPNPVPKAERGKPAKKSSVDQDQRIAPPAKEHPNPTPSTSSSAPSASKSTKAAASPTTAPTRVPYKAITSFACISNVNSQLSVPASSTRPSDSFQPATLKSGTAPVPNTSTKFPIAPASPARPQNQSQAVPAPASRPVVEPQAARDPVSPQTTHFQPQNLSVPSPVSSRCTPTNSLTAPKPISLTTNSSKAIQSQATDSTTPVPLDSRPEDMATSIPSQTSPMPLSTDKPASNLVSTPIHSPSSSPAPTHAISQTTSTNYHPGLVPVLYQTTTAAEVPGLKDPPAASLPSPAQTGSEQPDSAGVTTPVHVPQSVAPPAQPAQSYPVGFGTRLPYPPYPPYPAPLPSLSPNVSAPTTGLQLPSSAPTPPFSHAAESYLYEPAVSTVSAGAGGALVTDPLTQLCQDMLYPGFPQNDKNEQAQLPPFSRDSTGKDLPNDTSVLRFFFNLGLKAFLYQMLPPVSYLGPLVQAYRHMQLVPPSPVSWQPDNHSRPVITSSSPSPAGSTPVSHFELRGMVHTPHMEIRGFSHTSMPMQMPFPVASHPTVYAGMCPMPSFGPPLQYPAPPPRVGLHHLTISPPPPYAMEIPMPTVAPIMEEAQEVQRSLTPQVDKPFWAGQHQQPSEGGDIKSGAVPVTMGMQYSSGAQAVISGGGPGVGPEQTMLTNGNRQTRAGGFSGSSLEDWETEKAEFGAADSKTGQSYHGQSYKSGSRHGQDDRGGYRGRGSRGKREYTWGRQDGQLPYHRGRGKGRGYSNPRGSGYANRQFTRAPES